MSEAFDIPAYVINLDASSARLAAISEHFAQAGLAFTRVRAVDGRGLDLHAMPDCDPDRAMAIYGRPLKGGEYGCYKSHLACAQLMLDEGHPHALVFEDDVTLAPGFVPAVKAALALLQDSRLPWRLINLGAGATRIYTPVGAVAQGHSLVAAHYFPQGAFGILWNRRGAEEFVTRYSRVVMTVDNQFRHLMVRQGGGFAIVPPLVHHLEISSVIDAGHKASRYAGRRWNYGLLKQKRFWVNRAIAAYRKATFRLPAG